MNTKWFDTLTTSASRSGTRRGLIAALPLAGALGVLLGEAVQGKGKHKKKCAKAGQTPNKGKRKGCCNGLAKDASGRCAAPAPGPTPIPCTGLKPSQSLHEAIDGAASGDTLILCAGTWNLTSTVQIAKELTLIGAGAGGTVLDGGNASQVLEISAGANVTLQNLTVTKGKAAYGGGIYNNDATLTLSGVSVTGNTATNDGGGIWNKAGTLLLQNGSHVTGNAAVQGGGISSYLDEAMVTLQTGSSVAGNEGQDGAGIYNRFGTVTLEDSSHVTGNTGRRGAGIYNEGGTLTLRTGSRVTGNTATYDGGGIFAAGTVTLEGADPSPIVVNNCQTNCSGPGGVDKCAPPPVSCP